MENEITQTMRLCRAHKQKLENILAAQINDFQQFTGLSVKKIILEHSGGKEDIEVAVCIEVAL